LTRHGHPLVNSGFCTALSTLRVGRAHSMFADIYQTTGDVE
jgi:hypothetical protein